MERLLERKDELASLSAAVDDMLAGRGAVVLVAGEAGSGKSALVRALRKLVGGRASFLVGTCEPLSVPVPLGPLRELVEAAGAPGLVDLHGDDRFALAGALLDALRTTGPAIFVVEDAHWADPGTLDVVRMLARRAEQSAVVVVVTYRDDELAANHALATFVGDLATNRLVRRIALRALSESAVRELSEPAGLDARELAEVTNGNPFLVVEVVAAGGGIPASVRDATLARVSRLHAAARGVVDVAAVMGQRTRPALLEQIVPNSVDAIEEALARGVLVDDGESLGFRHELTRQAIEDSISAPRRAALHARVLAALRDDRAADPARLAHHAERAGLPDEAGRYAALAATEAERVGALAEASSQLARALQNGAQLDDAERFELLLRYVRATNFAGDLEDARVAAADAVAWAARELAPTAQGRALVVLAWALWSLDRVTEAKRAAERAVELLEATDDLGELARARAAELRMEAIAFDAAAVITEAPDALALAERAGLEEVRIDITISLALAQAHNGEPAAQQLLAGALSDAQAEGLPFQTIRAYVNAIDVAAEFRDHDAVDALAEAALDRLDAFQAAIPRETVLISLARSLLDRGRYEEAIEQARLGRRSRHGGVPLSLALEAVARARRGEPGAEALLNDASAAVADVPHGWRHGQILVGLAEAAWLRGDHEAVAQHVRAGLAAPHADRLARSSADLALWALRSGDAIDPPANAAAPAVLELGGDWREAMRAWRNVGAPYEEALAALRGDDDAARNAMAALEHLGAPAAARAFARERGRRGARTPRGPRDSTRANMFGLTRREQEVLTHVARGETNAGIAHALHLSERTVAHHVSAILRKLDVQTRMAAVEAARGAGLVAQDGQAPGQT